MGAGSSLPTRHARATMTAGAARSRLTEEAGSGRTGLKVQGDARAPLVATDAPGCFGPAGAAPSWGDERRFADGLGGRERGEEYVA